MPKTKLRTDQQNRFPFQIMNDFDQDLLDYTEALKEVVDHWWETTGKRLAKRELIQDAPDPFQSAFTQLDKNMKQVFAKENVKADVNKMARLVTTKAHSDLKAEINNYVGYDPMLRNQKSKKLAKRTIEETTSYVKSIPQEYHRAVNRKVLIGIREGKSIDEIAGALDDVYGKAAGRTRTIAMDQTGNLRGAITKAQHESLDLKKFEWVAVLDGRTRPRHQTFAGQTYTWKNGAGGEYPGSAINCRCTAATVKEEVQNVMQGRNQPEPEAGETIYPEPPNVDDLEGNKKWIKNNFDVTIKKIDMDDKMLKKQLKQINDDLYRLAKEHPKWANQTSFQEIKFRGDFDDWNELGGYKGHQTEKMEMNNLQAFDDVKKYLDPDDQFYATTQLDDAVRDMHQSTFRHELGHHLRMQGPRSEKYSTTSARWIKWNETVKDMDKGDDFWTDKVSEYGTTNNNELFSEAFSIYTHPRYKEGMLPNPIESFFKREVFGL